MTNNTNTREKELTGYLSIDKPHYKFYRDTPIRDFSEHQTMYDLVISINSENMDSPYSLYFGKSRTFSQLKQETDALAAALYHDGIRKNSVVGVWLLTVPEVDTVLLAVNKIGAISFWLDGRRFNYCAIISRSQNYSQPHL